jgi:hypothetical protein
LVELRTAIGDIADGGAGVVVAVEQGGAQGRVDVFGVGAVREDGELLHPVAPPVVPAQEAMARCSGSAACHASALPAASQSPV